MSWLNYELVRSILGVEWGDVMYWDSGCSVVAGDYPLDWPEQYPGL
jgi:hypothetical protein